MNNTTPASLSSSSLLASTELPFGPNLEHADGGSSKDLHSELDGTEADPIVVCGFSFKFPQDATSAEGLWQMMMEKRCAMTTFPSDRINLDGFHRENGRFSTVS